MATGRIPRAFIEQLLARTDIVQVIGQHIPLRKAGRNYVARCPFHEEKTPSFNVIPDRQFYHCFGCGASGDAIRFLQQYAGLDFREAVETLARQAGLSVPTERLTPEQQQRQHHQATLYTVLEEAARFYRRQLRDHPQAETARAYLRQRGLTPEIARRYRIGFAPPGWDTLRQAFPEDWSMVEPLLIECGLRVPREQGGSYDRFRHRLIFPIRDRRGRVVGFGGRVLDDADRPKYLNSPESPVFHKRETLYGLYEWLQLRRRDRALIVVEGYMDVIALAQHGLPNTVATLGTALSETHLQQLFQHVDTLIFSFDSDTAGRKAARRAAELLLPLMTERHTARFLFLPQGDDPDAFIRREGPEAFRRRMAEAPDVTRFVIEGEIAPLTASVDTLEGRRQFLAAITPWLKRARGWYQAALLEQAAAILQVRPWQLARQLGLRTTLATSRTPPRAPTFSAPPVVGLPHRILRLLLQHPHLAERLFTESDLAQLKRLDVPGADLLSWSIAQLQAGHTPEAILDAIDDSAQRILLQETETAPLSSDEQAAERQLRQLLAQLLTRQILAETDDIAAILALKRRQHDPR